jgi:hypothetical protein
MRFPTFALFAAMAITLATGCSGKNSNDQNASSNGSDAAASAAASAPADQNVMSPAPEISATANAGASSDATATSDAAGDIPSYPGATVQLAGTSASAGNGERTTGKVMSTSDSFDDVYHWYQKNLPAGSETVHLTAPVQTASFTMKGSGKNETTVTISTAQGKTVITVARISS